MCTMSRIFASRAARLAVFGISMPRISSAGDTMRALMPWISPLLSVATFTVSARFTLDSAMMSGSVASPVWQMCRNGMISVLHRGRMWRQPPNVAAPALPASTMVVTPECTPARSGSTPVRFTPSKTCACTSISPGVTSLPVTSIMRAASAGAIPAATRAILPCSTATSSTPSRPLAGSITLPPFSRRSYMSVLTWVPSVRGREPAPSFVARRALLAERRDALAKVRARAHGVPQRLLQRPRQEPVRGHDAVDQPDARGLAGVDQPRREQQLHGVDVADLLDQLDRRAPERVDGPLDLGKAEARVGRRRADVGGEQELHA